MSNGSPDAPSESGTSEVERGTSEVERGTSTAPVTLGALLSVPALDRIRETAMLTTFLASAYTQRGLRTVDTLKSSFIVTSRTYFNAYANYARAVRAAQAEALNQQFWNNVFLGIGIAAGVGLISGAILPAGLALGWRVLAEVAGEVTEVGVAGRMQAAGLTDVQDTNLEPAGVSPDTLNSQFWERLNALNRDMQGIQQHTKYLPFVLQGVEYVLGQVQVLEAGGKTVMSQAELVDLAESLDQAAAHLTQLNAELSRRLDVLDQLLTRARAAPRYSEEELECYIWILWMSTLSDNQSDILDRNPIEDRLHEIRVLGPNSLLGVDFGLFTSEDEELAALAAARREAVAFGVRYRALTGVSDYG
jgi:hypothetical protein